ncbi:MAG: heavy metal-associated domain-containing protein [Cypionkella sp.]|nr:heavy-metal-associated domain-containing protein [Cypionkella sp.]
MITLAIPDMSCGHCKASVEAALSPLCGVKTVTVDLASRQVQIDGSPKTDALLASLSEIGFPATLISAD